MWSNTLKKMVGCYVWDENLWIVWFYHFCIDVIQDHLVHEIDYLTRIFFINFKLFIIFNKCNIIKSLWSINVDVNTMESKHPWFLYLQWRQFWIIYLIVILFWTIGICKYVNVNFKSDTNFEIINDEIICKCVSKRSCRPIF